MLRSKTSLHNILLFPLRKPLPNVDFPVFFSQKIVKYNHRTSLVFTTGHARKRQKHHLHLVRTNCDSVISV